jgi:iron complex transport system permease protein
VGVVFNAFAAGVITVVKVMVPPDDAARLLYWLMGAVGYAGPGTLAAGAVLVGVAVAVLVALSARLNLLSLGDDEASSLGVDVGRARGAVFLAASLATGAAVALAGLVGFVGLIVPHVLRRLLGPDHRLLLPASALSGAAFLVLADTAARLAFLPLGSEPPVGALTALLGGPLFLWMLRRTERA